MKRRFVLTLCLILCISSAASAGESAFKSNNPDGYKYEFARSFIASMAYFQSIEKRLDESGMFSDTADEKKLIKSNLDRLAKDSLDLRVAKNYMVKYFNAGNPLMRKVVDTYAVVCDGLIDVNHRERELWGQWRQMRKVDEEGNVDLKEFRDAQEQLSNERKEIMRKFVEASVLMAKVLLSENTLEKQVKKRLALSTSQRDKLIKKLDSYASDNLDWGMKPGQTFLQGAEAIVREVLEDPSYLSSDE